MVRDRNALRLANPLLFHVGEECLKAVKIFGKKWIELVVVTFTTRHGRT